MKKIKIIPRQKSDKKHAKLMEAFFNHAWEKGHYDEVIEAVVGIQVYISTVYNIQLPMSLFNKIFTAIIKRDILLNNKK